MRHAVLDIFDGPHCGLCQTAESAGRAYLQGVMNDGVNDEALLTELDTFIRGSDHRFAHEPRGNERDSWLRAIRALGGSV